MLMKPSNKHKAQSAMEYLMTYGWAILIIAVVLGALFSLGVFSGNTLLGNACIASSGYYCQNLVYSHSNGELTATLGQNTGATWTSANFIFVPQGTPTSGGLPTSLSSPTAVTLNGNTLAGVSGLTSGQQESVLLPVNGISTGSAACSTACPNVGATETGAIWVQYNVNSGPLQYSQLATINIKAS